MLMIDKELARIAQILWVSQSEMLGTLSTHRIQDRDEERNQTQACKDA